MVADYYFVISLISLFVFVYVLNADCNYFIICRAPMDTSHCADWATLLK